MTTMTDFGLGMLVQHSLMAQDFAGVARMAGDLLLQRPHDATAHAVRAYAHDRLGRHEQASAQMNSAVAIDGGNPIVLYYAGKLAGDHGRQDDALSYLARSIDALPWFGPADQQIWSTLFPGEDYLNVLGLIHDRLRPRTYVEIGVDRGRSLSLAVHSETVIGIDPTLVRCPPELRHRANLIEATSEAFFADPRLHRPLLDRAFDFGFIDGLHRFDQTLRDFVNLERLSGPDSMVLIHDVIPVSSVVARPVRSSAFWAGDVWKIVPCLAQPRS